MNKIRKAIKQTIPFIICGIIIISPIAGTIAIASLWIASKLISKKLEMQKRLVIFGILCTIGALAIAIGSLVELPVIAVIALIALLMLCFCKSLITTSKSNNPHKKGFSERFSTGSIYPDVEVTCNGEYVEAEIIDDGRSSYNWSRNRSKA